MEVYLETVSRSKILSYLYLQQLVLVGVIKEPVSAGQTTETVLRKSDPLPLVPRQFWDRLQVFDRLEPEMTYRVLD